MKLLFSGRDSEILLIFWYVYPALPALWLSLPGRGLQRGVQLRSLNSATRRDKHTVKLVRGTGLPNVSLGSDASDAIFLQTELPPANDHGELFFVVPELIATPCR